MCRPLICSLNYVKVSILNMWGSLSLANLSMVSRGQTFFLRCVQDALKGYVLETKEEYRTFSGNDPCPLLCMIVHAHFLVASMAVDDPFYLVCTTL